MYMRMLVSRFRQIIRAFRHKSLRRCSSEPSMQRRYSRSTKLIVIVGTIGAVALSIGTAIRQADSASRSVTPVEPATSLSPPAQTRSNGRSRLQSRLGFQPRAYRMLFHIGRRFNVPGLEVATQTGVLKLGVNQHSLRITRSQDDADGEQVLIEIGGNPALSWSPKAGAKSSAGQATGSDRLITERIALDSIDQFILAQVRGVSYRMVARSVVPQGAAAHEDYNGPSWDVVRLNEPEGTVKPLSNARLYYINTVTGLIDKVVSQEAGEVVSAEFSNWANFSGEKTPTRVVWRNGDSILMEITLSGTNYTRKQYRITNLQHHRNNGEQYEDV